jgi:hypothetical protein
MSDPLPPVLAGIRAHRFGVLHLICGQDETHDLLLMEVRYHDGKW